MVYKHERKINIANLEKQINLYIHKRKKTGKIKCYDQALKVMAQVILLTTWFS